MEEKIIKIIAEVIEEPAENITLQSRASDFENWDSLALVTIISRVIDEVNSDISFDALIDIDTVSDLIKVAKKATNV